MRRVSVMGHGVAQRTSMGHAMRSSVDMKLVRGVGVVHGVASVCD